jgi:DNA (cytosine-5)-methyltransferase 3A
MIKLLIGGSPCTYWSIAQKNGRETEASGTGWELFKNYLIAKEKFKPDLFLYENNKSAAQAIKDQISQELGVPLMYINSALVSAQNRERFYGFNWIVDLPADRGILLRDILEPSALEVNYKLDTVGVGYRGRMEDGHWVKRYESNGEPKANALTTATTDSMVGEPIRIGTIENAAQNSKHDSQQYRVYSPNGKSVTLCGNGGGVGAKTGLYACPASGKEHPVYEVKNGLLTVKGKQYPTKLADGYYIIRKLTVTECCRLQTLPDDYCRAVSNSQAYKGLGNGWTAEVIIHVLNGALKDVPRDEEIVVLSMYDGIGTGRYCLDKMGFTNVKYFAYEIDKYAKQVAMSNYPDIIQLGNAFDLRHPDWTVGY